MMEDIFAIYMLASVERYDPAVVRREMSNKKVYLYDNGFAAALHYSGRQHVGQAEGLLLVMSAADNLDIPSWISVLPVMEWSLGHKP